VVTIVILVGLALYVLRSVLTPVFFALLIAYMLDPVVDRFEAMRVPRALGIVIVLSFAFALMTLFLVIAVPMVIRDLGEFVTTLPAKLQARLDAAEPWFAQFGITLPHTWEDVVAQLEASGADPSTVAGKAAEPLGAALSFIVGETLGAVGAILGAVMVPVLAFYLLYDFDRMTASIRDLIPPRTRPFVVDLAREVDEVMSQFIRGQLLVMIILGVLYAVGYSIVGVRLAILIGVFAGLLAFIPYVGSALALVLALLMCALDFQGWTQIIWVVVVYGVIQILEGFVITPKIVGDKVGLASIWVLLALLVAGEVFGFMGVLLAVPAAAVLKIFVVRAVGWYRKSRWFLAEQSPRAQGYALAGGGESAFAGILREEGLPDDPAMRHDKATAEPPPPSSSSSSGGSSRREPSEPGDIEGALRKAVERVEALGVPVERAAVEVVTTRDLTTDAIADGSVPDTDGREAEPTRPERAPRRSRPGEPPAEPQKDTEES
jgi:predicted PurR-regulated permease PerM